MSKMIRQGSKYTDEDRQRVAMEFFVTGNMTRVAENTGIPRTTLIDWKKTEWWDELAVKLRQEKGEELDANLTKLIDSAFEQAQDRVDNGDFRLVKTKKAIKHDDGSLEVSEDYELKRVPMGGKELTISAATAYDKQRLHRNEPTSIRADSTSAQSKIDYFEKIERDYQLKKANSIDGECSVVSPQLKADDGDGTNSLRKSERKGLTNT